MKLINKKNLIIFFICVFFIFSACKDPIFFTILIEPPKIEPKIKGSPTNFVLFNENMYVASGKTLYYYRVNETDGVYSSGGWNERYIGQNIGMLAASTSYLYMMCLTDHNKSVTREILRMDTAGSIAPIPPIPGDYTIVQSIYEANNSLYIGAQNSEKAYYIHELDSSGVFKDTGIHYALSGAAYNGSVFLCTNSGIFNNGILIGSASVFCSMINLGGGIAAITENGYLYKVEASGLSEIANLGSRNATGALTIWEGSSSAEKLLLVGKKDVGASLSSGYTYGYSEIVIDGNWILEGAGFKEPGFDPPTSVDDNQRYSSSLGVLAVNHMYQTKDKRIFAATHKDGVWSYKERNDGTGTIRFMWNAEDD